MVHNPGGDCYWGWFQSIPFNGGHSIKPTQTMHHFYGKYHRLALFDLSKMGNLMIPCSTNMFFTTTGEDKLSSKYCLEVLCVMGGRVEH